MVEEGFSWIYLIFFLVPLARILPRLVRKWRKGKSTFPENQFSQTNPEIEKRPESFEKPQNKEMRVLGELNKGVRDFNKIQRNLGIHNQELENILKGLEDKGLMKVVKKSGLVGSKVELYPTDKGFKKYYS
jgi:DNA-binding MarR family transcriptional regulator